MNTLIVIAGPTASGKSDLALHLALQFQCEILSADSRQFYREMNIGTAKPPPEMLEAVPHHFINNLSIREEYTAGQFARDALQCLKGLFPKNPVQIVVGGSGLYLKALCEGFDALPPANPGIRESLTEKFRNQGLDVLLKELAEKDPEHYRKIDRNNPHRVIRALEVIRITGRPYSSFRTGKPKPRPFRTIKIGLTLDRAELYQRINQRVDRMMEDGLLDEVRNLLPCRHLPALDSVGYKELIAYLQNEITLEEAVEAIKKNTRRYAKRQLTWFRKDSNIRWFAPENHEAILHYIKSRL